MAAMVLAGDVGGTKTLLGLFRGSPGKLREVRTSTFVSDAYPSFEAMVREFLSQGGERPRRVAVGVAGPIVDGRSRVVNLKWPVEERRVAKAAGTKDVRVLNDLEATGWGIGEVPPRRVVSLTPSIRARKGNGALIAAGTGLGMCALVRDGARQVPLAGEGGHQDFAPRDETEFDLLRHFQKLHGRVSLERIVAGPGLSEIYRFLVASGREAADPALESRFATEDPNAAVSEAGVAGSSTAARRALAIFVSLYGAAAGNFALVIKATGGVWVGGGIAPKILPVLRDGTFLESFRAKGRLRPMLEAIPVRVLLEPRTALLGAAAFAARGFR